MKFWANDNLLFQEPEERNNGLDTYVFTGRLKKGYNRLLLQIGASEINSSNFLVRITDTEGENLTGLNTTKETQPYTKDDFNPGLFPILLKNFLPKRLQRNPILWKIT